VFSIGELDRDVCVGGSLCSDSSELFEEIERHVLDGRNASGVG